MQSTYLEKLLKENPDVGQRYLMKLGLVNNLDPFTFTTAELDYSVNGIPPVTFPDIFSYIVLTHSFYSNEQMKAYKTLDAHKYFSAGFVLKVGTRILNDFHVMVGKVKHSQRANAKPLEAWCIITKDGSISNGHCTCMAGNSEVCSHIGALLFAAEYANRNKGTVSCTDVAALWPMPSLSTVVPIVPISEMDFGTVAGPVHVDISLSTMTTQGIINLLKRIEDIDQTVCLMRIVEPFGSKLQAATEVTLPILFSIFDERYISKNYTELMEIAKSINLSLTTEEVLSIEQHTRGQHACNNWYIQRAGRITASKLKSVCRTNKETPSLSLIKSICYPANVTFNSKATEWGLRHESVAVEEYKRDMEEKHEEFTINDVGIFVSAKWPQFEASPDRLVCCECCLGGALEVKCPYLLYTSGTKDIKEYAKSKNSCVVLRDNNITLKRDHSYYYQVQMQIFICNLKYCDFVIWSPFIFLKERMFPNLEFWHQNYQIALKFHREIIMPELLGRYFTRSEGTAKVNYWCNCKGVDDGSPMINCDNDECEIQWFHFKCVGLTDTPNTQWFCDSCKNE